MHRGRGARAPKLASHKDLRVWKDAIALVESVYRLTASFPKTELFGLTSQLRRSAVSVASNIAEGAARRTRAEYLHFLYIARGSISELDTQIEIAYRMGLAERSASLDDLINRVGRSLSALIGSLRRI